MFILQVCLQFPDSLLADSARVALYLQHSLERKVYILGDTTCGSCCVDEIAANHIKADGIIHFGHACLSPTARLAVFHVLERREIDVDGLCRTVSRFFDDTARKILLFYDVAYAHAIGQPKLHGILRLVPYTKVNKSIPNFSLTFFFRGVKRISEIEISEADNIDAVLRVERQFCRHKKDRHTSIDIRKILDSGERLQDRRL